MCLLLGQESGRTKVSRIFRIFVPNFAPNFAPNFPRIFRGLFVLRFVGDGDQKKFTRNPRHFSMQNSQANTEKIFTKFFWRAGRVTFVNHCQLMHLIRALSVLEPLVSHYSAIGDTISCDTPYSAIGFRDGGFFCDNPLVRPVFGLR